MHLKRACSSHGVFISLGFQILEEKIVLGRTSLYPTVCCEIGLKQLSRKRFFKTQQRGDILCRCSRVDICELSHCKTGWPYGMMRTLPLLHSHSPLLCRTPRLTSKPQTSNTVQPSPPHSCPLCQASAGTRTTTIESFIPELIAFETSIDKALGQSSTLCASGLGSVSGAKIWQKPILPDLGQLGDPRHGHHWYLCKRERFSGVHRWDVN
jgi:hypothetical protein